MKRSLRRINSSETWYVRDGIKTFGVPSRLTGDVTWLWGNVTWLRGDVSGLSGNVSGLRGDVSGLRGVIGECELTREDRASCVKIEDLIKEAHQ